MTEFAVAPITYDRSQFSDQDLLDIHDRLLYPRMIEKKMLSLLRQGRISKWFSGIGQEAISVGCTLGMKQEEMMFTMHRNLGVFTTRDIPLTRLFSQWQGKAGGFTNGRDRSFHFGTKEYNITGMISHLGPQLSLAAGVALGYKLQGKHQASLAFTGEGGTSQGEFHEALNVAAVWGLPALFVIENNGYGLSTPTSEQYICKQLADRGVGYGIESVTIDGNNILEVITTIKDLARRARTEQKPFLIECMTFRMRGHEEASGTKYVPQDLFDTWSKKDPLSNFEELLVAEKLLTQEEIDEKVATIKKQINADIASVIDEENVAVILDQEVQDVYAQETITLTKATGKSNEVRFVDALADAHGEAMAKYDDLVLMGQDIAEYGGVFKITDGLVEKYGQPRVRNTPLCESAIVGIAMGLSLTGQKAMMEMQFADFVSCGFNQIVNNLAKSHYRWSHKADVVIRMPTGGTTGAGPYHSQSMEAWFTHVPGLKVVYPSTAHDAKGLLLAAFEDPNPVMFFEHKALYRTETGLVPEGYYTEEIGKARVVSTGDDVTIITYGMGVRWAKTICKEHSIDAYILDLRSLVPLDYDAIDEAVMATHRVVVLHEATGFGGIGGEISAYINEHLFEHLDAPVLRCSSLDTPVPFDGALEDQFMAKARLEETIKKLLKY